MENKNFELSLNGPKSSYDFSWKFVEESFTSTQFKLEVSLFTSLFGYEAETFVLKIKDLTTIKDEHGLVVHNDETSIRSLERFEILNPTEETASAGSGGTTLIAVALGLGLSTALSFLMGNTLESTWLLLNTIQLMSLTPIVSVNLPTFYREFAKNLISLHG